jgi:uncharacterized membrane protein YedE/YeeE
MNRNFIALSSGILFGLGLSLSQMVNPSKVLGFMDIAGDWDPSLALVMMGALAVTFVTFRWILKRPAPLLDKNFYVPGHNTLDKPLLLGAALFGIGWGMSGYCPGPAVAGMGMLNIEALVMVASICIGFFAHKLLTEKKT